MPTAYEQATEKLRLLRTEQGADVDKLNENPDMPELERSELLAGINTRNAAIEAAIAEKQTLGEAVKQAELERSAPATSGAPSQTAPASGGGGELKFERAVDEKGGSHYRPVNTQGISLARQLMESPGWKANPKNSGVEVALSDYTDMVLGRARNDTRPIPPEMMRVFEMQRAVTTYGLEPTTQTAGVRGFIPYDSAWVDALYTRPRFAQRVSRTAIDGLSLRWMKKTTRTKPADDDMTIAEGAAAPEATIQWTPQIENLTRIRTWVPTTEEALQSESQVQDLLQNDLAMMVNQTLSRAMIRQDGGANEIRGFATTRTGMNDVTVDMDESSVDVNATALEVALNSAILEVRTDADEEPDAIHLHPVTFDPLKNLQRSGRYVFDPVQSPAQMMWRGIPIYETFEFNTPADGAVVGIVGNFQMGVDLLTFGDIQIATTDSHGELFPQWEVAIRAGLWAQMRVKHNEAFCTITRDDS